MTASPTHPAQGAPAAAAPELAQGEEMSQEVFRSIGAVLKEHDGFTLECYKDKCAKRRIGIRIRATGSASPEDYCELLARDGVERDELLRVLTIHVSHFFRNPSTFAKLSREILPPLLKGRGDGEEVHLWSVGCAAGEEPYTLALIMKERFPSQLARLKLSITGTDVDAATLKAAAGARYGTERLEEVERRLLERWFTPAAGKYELADEIRKMVAFRKGDLNDPGSYLKSDLILCRNVLIYFERARQEEILLRFADALSPGGVLVLGKSETLVGQARRRFATVCPVERIYRVV
ncbi:protein-glutamate O-methyltransferase CheR [Geomonas sp. RF6]|uniref:CheR family methyltransferase n=1 Tax=Geomonas sp. RF6 TaxID=2897342 RepID=UPI001E64DACF|nr:protein-glutamate O-methyltransferase CheR [Geomonas sp. RF6]UFS71563.1 protein-glutamate O-methyltransferase CheR [Geomonas sp. RF6]